MDTNLRSADDKTDRERSFQAGRSLKSDRLLDSSGRCHCARVWTLGADLVDSRLNLSPLAGTLFELPAGADGLPGPDSRLCLSTAGLPQPRTETKP